MNKYYIVLLVLMSFSAMSQKLSKEERQADIDDRKAQRLADANAKNTAKPSVDSTGRVIYRLIVDVDTTISQKDVYRLAKSWLVENKPNFNGSKGRSASGAEIFFGVPRAHTVDVDQSHLISNAGFVEDFDQSRITTSGIFRYDGSSLGCLRLMYLDFDIKVAAKKGKVKIEMFNFKYRHYNQVNLALLQLGGWSDSGACQSTGNLEWLLDCRKCEEPLSNMYYHLNAFVNTLNSSFRKEFINPDFSIKDEEKW